MNEGAISADEWRQIVHSAVGTAIITTDLEGRVSSLNAGASRMLGWSAADVLGETLERLLTTLKIDRSFISEILTKPQDAAIVRAIVSMGNELGLHMIAEGVETAEQEAFLKILGCEAVQGYRFGKPEPAEAIAALVRQATLLIQPTGQHAV